MLDIKFIRDNKDIVAEGAKKKRIDFDVAKLLDVDERRRAVLAEVEALRAKQNEHNTKITSASESARAELIAAMKELKTELQAKEEVLATTLREWRLFMLQVPNVPDISVPEGESDADNQEIQTWGEIPKFDFEIKNHVDLLLTHDMADYERGAKVAGFRGYFLKNDGARLMWALERFVIEHFSKKTDFVPMVVPSMVKKEPFMGTGYLPQSEEDLYKTQDGDYLAGTAEVATMGYFMDEILEKKNLPLKFFAFSPCFRREAGSHGKDTKGLFRIHEFMKFEQVVLCEANHAVSVSLHEELTKNSEELLQALGLPYRVVVNCGADLGLGQVKKYDIEAWMPSEGKYRETHSSSYFHDFQTRRLNIRYRDDDKSLKYAHSLNNTALAMPRVITQIVENYQKNDGSIKVPDALIPYMGKEEIKKF